MQPKLRLWTLLVCALIIFSASACLAKTVYVKTTGLDTNNGLSWSTAKKTVAAGITASTSGDEIWVAAGTYIERITLKAGTGLYGGFTGMEALRTARNWRVNVTVLSGNSGSAVTSPSGATATTVVDGFTIRNSSTGGVVCSSSSPTISNNTITGNGAVCGAGVYCYSSSPTIVNNAITGNSASDGGGGIYCYLSSPTVVNNTITGNCAPSAGGGAVGCYRYSAPTVSNNIMSFNSSGIYSSGGSPVLRNNCVYNPNGLNYSGLSAGTGDISLDPKLASAQYGQVHIEPDSPCVNAGWNSALMLPAMDIDGQARIQPTEGIVDIGADESDGTTWTFIPAVVRVKPAGNDANDGSTWALAKKTVQAGLNTASLAGGEVWVAAGTYNENIIVPPFAYLYGGFAGTEISRSQRNWKTNATVLDGGRMGVVVQVLAGYEASTIDGLVIRNGRAPNGAGVCCSGSSLAIVNNVITGNTTTDPTAGQDGFGGGIYCTSPATITNNMITGNTAYKGAGVYCSSSSSRISGNAIAGNRASYDGGGIFCYSSSPAIINNTITGNSASQHGGGICCDYASSPAVANNIVAFNTSGVCEYSGSGTPVLNNNCVYNPDGTNYTGLSAGASDISLDPKLEAVEYGRSHIQSDSPCKDAGLDSAVGAGWTDMDAQDRIQGAHVEIGADESDSTTWTFTPAVIRVKPAGNDANDGSTWALAKKTVQAGLNTASLAGGEVWVAAGTYNENIIVPPFAYLYGGFAGTEISRSQRNWKTNTTMLDGRNGGSVVQVLAGHKASTIDGFMLTNGGAVNGGGICCYCVVSILNNTINGNRSATTGGGIYCSSPATIANNTITGNTSSSSGGGIYCSTYASAVIIDNVITGNSVSSGGRGGGIYCDYCSPIIINNTITGNTSSYDGGGICYADSVPKIANNIVAFNSSGICQSGGSIATAVENNCVYGNTSYNYVGLSARPGDISLDPKLEAVEYGRVHIQPGSPCRNTGDDSAIGVGWLDMDGQARIGGGHVDIGADESDDTIWTYTPAVIRIKPSGNDANDGSTWALAKRTVQAGLGVASASGGEVWVAAGTYYERTVLPAYVYLYGGFAGTETSKSQRNWKTNITVLDGGRVGSVVQALAGHKASTIDGFVIRNGSAATGGGIYYTDASPLILNNTISGNSASSVGGGIYCGGPWATIANNTITGNTAPIGGGVYCFKSVTITSNTVSGNTASSNGGGIACVNSSYPKLTGNIVTFNSSGVYLSYGTPTLRSNCVYGNTTYNYSGLAAGAGDISVDPLFVNRMSGDYHLTGASPCINKGLNTALGLPTFDYDGEGRIFGGTVDIGADEFWSSLLSANETKKAPEAAVIKLSASTVSGRFTDFFYVESDDRSGGIRVDKAGYQADEDSKVIITGKVKTNDSGERFIAADSVLPDTGTLDIKPILFSTRDLGGGEIGLQAGVDGGAGVNNIGLLVGVIGNVTFAGTGVFYLDDGSRMDDGSGQIGIKVLATGLTFPDHGLVRVTGIVSCEKNGDKLIRLLRLRKQDDILGL